jgi:hypothetical protein
MKDANISKKERSAWRNILSTEWTRRWICLNNMPITFFTKHMSTIVHNTWWSHKAYPTFDPSTRIRWYGWCLLWKYCIDLCSYSYLIFTPCLSSTVVIVFNGIQIGQAVFAQSFQCTIIWRDEAQCGAVNLFVEVGMQQTCTTPSSVTLF